MGVQRQIAMMTPEEIIKDLSSERIKDIIVDCDMGADGDDQFALGYALASPDRVRVLAVTSSPYNENSHETVLNGAAECRDIIEASGQRVKYGAFPGSPNYITKTGKAVPGEGVEAIARIVRESDGPVYTVSTGCITTVASALMLYPDIADKLVTVWLALDGLSSSTNTGEYNYHNDIEGGKAFFSLSKNIVLVEAGRVVAPFHRTNEQICESYNKSKLAKFLAKRFCEISWAQGLWDLCAESVLILPDACEFSVSHVPVFDSKGEISSFDENRRMVTVCKNNPDRIAKDALDRINNL